MIYTIRRTWVLCLILITVLSGCGLLGGGASDVPSFSPTAWPENTSRILVRPETAGGDALLLSSLTYEQWNEYEDDDVLGNGPHGAVYRFDPADERFTRVDDLAWDQAVGPVSVCNLWSSADEDPFSFEPPGATSQALFFQGTPVAVPGGNPLALFSARHKDVVAVLSTNGQSPIGASFFIFIVPRNSSGQHYHQLFSTINGSPVGPPSRLPLTSLAFGVPQRTGCFALDDQYVIYFGGGRLALVRVADTIEEVYPTPVGDVPGFATTAWDRDGRDGYLARLIEDGGGRLLLTHAAYGNSPCQDPREDSCRYEHGPVYQFDPADESFQLVDDSIWNSSYTDMEFFLGAFADWRADDLGELETPFELIGDGPFTLMFAGSEVAVAGGKALATFPAPASEAVAVLSTAGVRRLDGSYAGQHYHQLFSRIDGSPLSEPIRLPASDANRNVQEACWTADERYIVYSHDRYGAVDLVCVLPGYQPFAGDCDENGISDEDEIATGRSEDCNDNGIPDDCEENFVWFLDDFETDKGWSVGAEDDDAVTGLWIRVDPSENPVLGSPNAARTLPAFDRSPLPGTMCFVTGQNDDDLEAGDNDVDDGKTTLLSPRLDLSEVTEPSIGYWRWYSNRRGFAPNDDIFTVDMSSDDGATWVNAESVGPSGEDADGRWFYHEFRVSGLVTPTSQIRMRFIAADEGEASFIEAAIDDFRVTTAKCVP